MAARVRAVIAVMPLARVQALALAMVMPEVAMPQVPEQVEQAQVPEQAEQA
jgi:hypothetical protein